MARANPLVATPFLNIALVILILFETCFFYYVMRIMLQRVPRATLQTRVTPEVVFNNNFKLLNFSRINKLKPREVSNKRYEHC